MSVSATDDLPVDDYYSTGLDTGAGPQPGTVNRHGSGTTTLTWSVGVVAAGADGTIGITTRPSLLVTGGTALGDTATVGWSSAGGCVYAPVSASGSVTVTEVAPTRRPAVLQGYWKTHQAGSGRASCWPRIQATDQRYDGNGDGVLAAAEVTAAFSPSGQPDTLRQQLIAAYFDLGTRRINASTHIVSRTATSVGVSTVGAAARYAIATLALPRTSATAARYVDATTLLDEIDTGKSERY